jgi:type IV pilus assembly protein PilM
VREVTGDPRPGRRRTAALILPDHSCRTAVLDFDSFPANADEQRALLKFRMRKSVPFDIESASLAYHMNPRGDGKKMDVVVSVMAQDNLQRYEAPFRAAGLHVGLVSPSGLSMLHCLPAGGCRVVLKLSGVVLTIAAVVDGALRLLRTIEVPEQTPDAVDDHLLPTLTYMEDEWQRRAEAIHLVAPLDEWAQHWQAQGLPVEPLPSPFGKASSWNAGLMGYLAAGGRA